MNNFMKTFTHKVNLEKLTKKELIEMIENRKIKLNLMDDKND